MYARYTIFENFRNTYRYLKTFAKHTDIWNPSQNIQNSEKCIPEHTKKCMDYKIKLIKLEQMKPIIVYH